MSLADLSLESGMDKEQRSLHKPSDHIPVWATFDAERIAKRQRAWGVP
jgi:exonuclease III